MVYVLDANTFIEAKNRYYGFGICPAYWDWVTKIASLGEVCSLDSVKDELLKQKDELSEWAKENESIFVSMDGPTLSKFAEVSQWVQDHSVFRASAKKSFLSGADPQLIAYACAHGHSVVTLEKSAPDAVKIVKIPDVCNAFNVEYIDTFALLNRLKARFILDNNGSV